MSGFGIKPTHRLRIKAKTSGATGEVGVGWLDQEDGHVSLRLNPGIVLDWRDDVYLTLFPVDDKAAAAMGADAPAPRKGKRDAP